LLVKLRQCQPMTFAYVFNQDHFVKLSLQSATKTLHLFT
jgi:hypothetical protein